MLDKAELRRAVKTLGYQADPKDCDALFDTIDESGDGHVDFDEMKRALNSFLKGRMPTPRAASRGSFSGISPPGTPGRQQSMANFADLARNNARVVLSNLPAVEDAGELPRLTQPPASSYVSSSAELRPLRSVARTGCWADCRVRRVL